MKHVLAILIDASRYDYLSENDIPYRYSLSNRGFCAPLRTILGHSDAIGTTIFTAPCPQDYNY